MSELDEKLIAEYKAIKFDDFKHMYDFFNTRVRWIETKLKSGELIHGSETNTIICNYRE